MSREWQRAQHQSERQRHTDKSPYYTQRKMDRETVRARSRDRDTESSVPCGLAALSKGAQQYQTGSVPSSCHPDCMGLCSVKETIQPHCPLRLSWDTLGEHPKIKGPVGHRSVLSDMEVGIHGLNLWKAKEVAPAPGFCQMEDRQCAWRWAPAKQRHHVAHWSSSWWWGWGGRGGGPGDRGWRWAWRRLP